MTCDSDRPVLVVPAAGAGTRLKRSTPKFLVEVAGRPMVHHLLELYAPYTSAVILVVAPTAVAEAHAVLRDCASTPFDVCVQAYPTGMLDALLQATAAVRARGASRVWVTWCDQVGIRPATLDRLADAPNQQAALALPTACVRHPYIHFERDATGRICAVRQRREGDTMPPVGETDAGLFSLSQRAFIDAMPEYARGVAPGTGTGERNLLPFVPWLAARAEVRTFECEDPMEALGINTPEDLSAMERWLLGRTRA